MRQAGPAPQAHVPEERGTENVQCTPARGAPPGYPVSSFLSLCPSLRSPPGHLPCATVHGPLGSFPDLLPSCVLLETSCYF